MTTHFTRTNSRFRTTFIGTLLVIPLATLTMAGPDFPGGGLGIPGRGGVIVGTPGDTLTGSNDPRGGGQRMRSAAMIPGSTSLIAGDVNRDGRVDAHDLAAFLDLLGTDDARGDIDGDGQVDGEDFARLVLAWN